MNLLKQEQQLQFDHFKHSDALQFGLNILKIVEQEKLKNVRIRVRYENDLVFQYLMNDKNGEMWLDRKEKTVLESGHSSLYVYENQELYPDMIDNNNYAVCGGGFPLIEQGKIKGVFCVSGLEHDQDHRLIIDSLKEVLNHG